MLLASVTESMGLALVLPLISSLTGVPEGNGMVAEISIKLREFIPDGIELEGLVALLALAFLLKGALLVLTRGAADYFSFRLREDWATQVFEHYLRARYAYTTSQRQGAMVNNITLEPYRAARAITVLLDFLNRIILASVLLTVLLFTNWQTTIAISLAGALLFFAVRKSTFRYSLHFGKLRQKLYQQISSIGAEATGAVLQVKLFGIYDQVTKELTARLKRHTRAETIFRVLNEIPLQSTEFLIVLFLSVALIALKQVGDVAPESIAAMLGFYVILGQRLLTNVNFIISRRMKIASQIPSLMLMYDLIENIPDREDTEIGDELKSLNDDIVFENVIFRHNNGKQVFNGINLRVLKGQITALVGPSGAGKSTFADLILGLYAPDTGDIHIGTRELREFNLRSVRQRIGYVSQTPEIFNTSIRENIRIGRPDASDAELETAARDAHALSFISELPDGFDTVVGDRGVKLSGGQRQRIAIARVILRQPDLYIFDEATSALDTESERLVQDSIQRLARNATIVIIAHRLSTVKSADIIYELDDKGHANQREFSEIAV
jgi:ABC-type multidrug transport system fused ATPase/permease subunit